MYIYRCVCICVYIYISLIFTVTLQERDRYFYFERSTLRGLEMKWHREVQLIVTQPTFAAGQAPKPASLSRYKIASQHSLK